MEKLKISIIGAGSGYTSELVEELVKQQQILPVDELILYDIDKNRLQIMADFCNRYVTSVKSRLKITIAAELIEAIEDVRFIDVQIRVGGNSQRVLDERIPLKYGMLGQETTGVGGMMKAFRTIPVMLEIARMVEKHNPLAWLINYTNPTGLVTEAITKYTKANMAGLCSGGLFPKWWTNKALGVQEADVDYSYVGLNHMNFAYGITVKGIPVSDEDFDKILEVSNHGEIDVDLMKKLRLIPSPYLQYFFHRSRKIAGLLQKPTTRGEDILKIEDEVFKQFADPQQLTKPEALAKRGGGGYSEVAINVMKAMYTNNPQKIIVNVPNSGAIGFLPDDAVVEIPCHVSAAGIVPLVVKDIPPSTWGLIAAVKNYEQLALEAAVQGSKDLAELALLAHPLVGDYDIIKPMLKEMFDANTSFITLKSTFE
jgi:6-phospho-beta-glucosidase